MLVLMEDVEVGLSLSLSLRPRLTRLTAVAALTRDCFIHSNLQKEDEEYQMLALEITSLQSQGQHVFICNVSFIASAP